MRGLKVTLRLPVHKAVAQLLDDALSGIDLCVGPHRGRLRAHGSAAGRHRICRDGDARGAADPRRPAHPAHAGVCGRRGLRFAASAARGAQALRVLCRASAPPPTPAISGTSPWCLTLLEQSLLPLLDGTHSHDALAEHLEAEVRADRLRFVKDDKPLTDPSAVSEFARQQVSLALDGLRRKALLTG